VAAKHAKQRVSDDPFLSLPLIQVPALSRSANISEHVVRQEITRLGIKLYRGSKLGRGMLSINEAQTILKLLRG
jgi:hypothetical protein